MIKSRRENKTRLHAASVPAPSPHLGRGLIMQPTPRGSGVWVEAGTWPSPPGDGGREIFCRRATLLFPERKLRWRSRRFRQGFGGRLHAGAYAPAAIMSPVLRCFGYRLRDG